MQSLQHQNESCITRASKNVVRMAVALRARTQTGPHRIETFLETLAEVKLSNIDDSTYYYFQTCYTPGGGGGNFLMSGIRVCATDQRRFFTSKNPEQAPNF